jgi:hypothetical protein
MNKKFQTLHISKDGRVAEPFAVQQDEFALLVMSIINININAFFLRATSHGAQQRHAIVGTAAVDICPL